MKQEQGYSLDYLLGILNSRLMNWYYQIINPEQGEALAEIKAAHLYRFPHPPYRPHQPHRCSPTRPAGGSGGADARAPPPRRDRSQPAGEDGGSAAD
ncbi:MAG: hypothetical protein IPH95_11120 [Candidatus Promineofilum sp.]|nr:hypothetical protein [Promineifilum sp.]